MLHTRRRRLFNMGCGTPKTAGRVHVSTHITAGMGWPIVATHGCGVPHGGHVARGPRVWHPAWGQVLQPRMLLLPVARGVAHPAYLGRVGTRTLLGELIPLASPAVRQYAVHHR